MENNFKNTIFEEWKPIKGFEGLYEVSNQGRVRSLDRIIIDEIGRNRLYKGRIMKPRDNSKGYHFVGLYKNGVIKTPTVHRLVAEAFIPNPDNKPEIDHLNTNRKDNRVENLMWATSKENNNNPLTLTKRVTPIIQYTTYDNQPIAWWNSITECSRFTKISIMAISHNLTGRTKTVCNKEFYFKYAA